MLWQLWVHARRLIKRLNIWKHFLYIYERRVNTMALLRERLYFIRLQIEEVVLDHLPIKAVQYLIRVFHQLIKQIQILVFLLINLLQQLRVILHFLDIDP